MKILVIAMVSGMFAACGTTTGDDVAGEVGGRGSGDGGGGDHGGGDHGGGAAPSGRDIFRFDTFGDEQKWTDTLRLHEVIEAAVSPTVALSVGLKVDAEVVPPEVLASADLSAPATTLALLELGAVVGVKGTVENGHLVSVG